MIPINTTIVEGHFEQTKVYFMQLHLEIIYDNKKRQNGTLNSMLPLFCAGVSLSYCQASRMSATPPVRFWIYYMS